MPYPAHAVHSATDSAVPIAHPWLTDCCVKEAGAGRKDLDR